MYVVGDGAIGVVERRGGKGWRRDIDKTTSRRSKLQKVTKLTLKY